MKYSRYIKIIIIELFLITSICQAEVPESKEEIVYELNLWNGRNFIITFCPQTIEEIYIMADESNIFSVRETEVYYWPITKEYKANWFKKNDMLGGYLEILKNNKVVKKIETKMYSLKYVKDKNTEELELLIGKQAQDTYNEFKEKKNKYVESVRNYYAAMQKYEKEISNLLEKKDEKGKSYIEDNMPKQPKEPLSLKEYISEPEKSFILKLNEGNYKIRFRDENGKIVPGTEKKLIVFTNRRIGLGYKVLPEERWTYPDVSNESGDILYIEGKQTIFIQAFNAAEYPERGYAKLFQLPIPESSQLSENVWRWVHLTPRYQEEKLQLIRDGKVINEITQKPYYVKQTQGHTLGYEIVEWGEDIQSPPTFNGYRLEISGDGRYSIRMLDKNGKILINSIRQIRPVVGQNISWLFIISMIPFFTGMGILLWRKE